MHGLVCPECGVPAASVGGQACARCGLSFVALPGHASDPSIVPSHPQSNQFQVQVKAQRLVLPHYGVLEPMGVAAGKLDPIVAMVPLDQSGVMYPHIVSLALWRKIDWTELVVALLIPIPLGALLMIPGVTGL